MPLVIEDNKTKSQEEIEKEKQVVIKCLEMF
jgi:hypothetical protein